MSEAGMLCESERPSETVASALVYCDAKSELDSALTRSSLPVDTSVWSCSWSTPAVAGITVRNQESLHQNRCSKGGTRSWAACDDKNSLCDA